MTTWSNTRPFTFHCLPLKNNYSKHWNNLWSKTLQCASVLLYAAYVIMFLAFRRTAFKGINAFYCKCCTWRFYLMLRVGVHLLFVLSNKLINWFAFVDVGTRTRTRMNINVCIHVYYTIVLYVLICGFAVCSHAMCASVWMVWCTCNPQQV